MIQSTEVLTDSFDIKAAITSGAYSPEIIETIQNTYPWLGSLQKTSFEALFTLFLNPTESEELRLCAGENLRKISFSDAFQEHPIILEHSIKSLLDAFTSINIVLAQYGIDVISQQLLHSDKMYIPFFAAGLLSNYFIELCDKIDLSHLILALSKWQATEAETETMVAWCADVINEENSVIGNTIFALKALCNIKCHERKNSLFSVPVDNSVLQFIYENCSSENTSLRDSCFLYLFYSNDDLQPILEPLFDAVGNSVSEDGFRLILSHADVLTTNLPNEMSKLLLYVASCYPYPLQKAAISVLFNSKLHINISSLEIFPILLHFLEDDDDIVEDVASAMINYIIMSPMNESLQLIEMLDDYSDAIHQLSLSDNEQISEYGNFLETISAPIPED